MTPIRSLSVVCILTVGLSACTTEQVVDNTVDTGLFATRTVVKTGVGAGKLVVKGGNRVVRGRPAP